jgi:hypothetical protein
LKVVLTGWKPGLKKISLDMLLVKRLHVSIVVAKKYVDDLIAGDVIELEIDSATASEFLNELTESGVVCHLEPQAGELNNDSSAK